MNYFLIPGIKKNAIQEIVELDDTEKIKQSLMTALDLTDIMVNNKTRKREITEPRQFLHFAMSIYTKLSLAKIGEICGKKDHATILHSYKTVVNLMETDCKYKAKYLQVLVDAGLNIEKVIKLLKIKKEENHLPKLGNSQGTSHLY